MSYNKSSKNDMQRKYKKYKEKYQLLKKTTNYNLGDGAQVSIIKNYISNTKDIFDELKSKIPWRRFEYFVHGRKVKSPRLMNIVDLTVDNNNLDNFNRVKRKIERIAKRKFTYAVLNYYRNGKDYIGFHADREVGKDNIVVSVSLGATRRFVLRHKIREMTRHEFLLEDGDVMIFNEKAIKSVYKHSIPKMANVGQRINITFRQ